jgi:hypothetical protein
MVHPYISAFTAFLFDSATAPPYFADVLSKVVLIIVVCVEVLLKPPPLPGFVPVT